MLFIQKEEKGTILYLQAEKLLMKEDKEIILLLYYLY